MPTRMCSAEDCDAQDSRVLALLLGSCPGLSTSSPSPVRVACPHLQRALPHPPHFRVLLQNAGSYRSGTSGITFSSEMTSTLNPLVQTRIGLADPGIALFCRSPLQV